MPYSSIDSSFFQWSKWGYKKIFPHIACEMWCNYQGWHGLTEKRIYGKWLVKFDNSDFGLYNKFDTQGYRWLYMADSDIGMFSILLVLQ